MSALPIAGKTGTAQGASSYPWNDSSVFAAFSLDDTKPYTVVAYLEKSGYGAKAAAPVVKCIFTALAGKTVDGSGAAQRSARPQLDCCRQPPHPVDRRLVHAAGRRRPGLSDHGTQHACRASRTPVSATSGPAPARRAATSTGCCCSPRARSSIIGLFTIYSASYSKFANPYLYVTRQEIFLIGAVISMIVVMSFDYDWWRERARFLYGVTVMLLVLVILVGAISGGARLSFDLGPLKVQPAEFAKFTGAARPGRVPRRGSHRHVELRPLRQGAAARRRADGADHRPARPRHGVGADRDDDGRAADRRREGEVHPADHAAVGGHRRRRGGQRCGQRLPAQPDQRVLPPGLDAIRRFATCVFQGRNSLRAIATGGHRSARGGCKGQITNSKDIPVQWADFPFSAIGEQFGLIGCGVVVGLFAIVLLRIWRIAGLSRDMLGTYLCAGVFTMVLWQMFQNIAMSIGLMPITGLPLPFISYGGSSIVTFFALMGLVQSVHMRRYR